MRHNVVVTRTGAIVAGPYDLEASAIHHMARLKKKNPAEEFTTAPHEEDPGETITSVE